MPGVVCGVSDDGQTGTHDAAKQADLRRLDLVLSFLLRRVRHTQGEVLLDQLARLARRGQ